MINFSKYGKAHNKEGDLGSSYVDNKEVPSAGDSGLYHKLDRNTWPGWTDMSRDQQHITWTGVD